MLDWSNLKVIANYKLNGTQKKINFVFVCNKMLREMEKMLITSIFSFYPNVFYRLLSWGLEESRLCALTLSQTSPGFYVSAVKVF